MLHNPVMLNEIIENFPVNNPHPLQMWDGTFGRGGHASEMLNKFPELQVYASDQDRDAIEYGEQTFKALIENKRLFLVKSSFKEISQIISQNKWPEKFDYILLDLGVSSPQLDEPARGFSFYHSGPLDMRMDRDRDFSASNIINEWEEEDLIEIFQTLGEVRKPYRVVRAIVHDRKQTPFTTTTALAELIARVDGWRNKGKHPATQYFMALRLVVNRELKVLEEVLPEIIKNNLKLNGRISVLTFHSLEDRIVKNIFKSHKEWGFPVNKKVIVASRDEEKNNVRSRSAKLRVFERSEPRVSKYN